MVKYNEKNPYCGICQIYKHGKCKGQSLECEILDLGDKNIELPKELGDMLKNNPLISEFFRISRDGLILIKNGNNGCVTLKYLEEYEKNEEIRKSIGTKSITENDEDLKDVIKRLNNKLD